MLNRVISGGQTGVDRAALEAAKSVGFDTGGWMPKGFRAEDGQHPEFADLYGMSQGRTTGYPERTRLNIEEADATFLITPDPDSAGSRLARRICQEMGKPLHVYVVRFEGPDMRAHFHRCETMKVVAPALIAEQMNEYGTINIAGTRDERVHLLILPWFNLILSTVKRWQEQKPHYSVPWSVPNLTSLS